MSEEVRSRLLQTVARQFGVAADEVTPAHGLESLPGWDSLGHLNLLLAVEEAFEVRFHTDRLGELKTVGSILDELLRYSERSDGRSRAV